MRWFFFIFTLIPISSFKLKITHELAFKMNISKEIRKNKGINPVIKLLPNVAFVKFEKVRFIAVFFYMNFNRS